MKVLPLRLFTKSMGGGWHRAGEQAGPFEGVLPCPIERADGDEQISPEQMSYSKNESLTLYFVYC